MRRALYLCQNSIISHQIQRNANYNQIGRRFIFLPLTWYKKCVKNNDKNDLYNELEINCIFNQKSKFHLGILGIIKYSFVPFGKISTQNVVFNFVVCILTILVSLAIIE